MLVLGSSLYPGSYNSDMLINCLLFSILDCLYLATKHRYGCHNDCCILQPRPLQDSQDSRQDHID